MSTTNVTKIMTELAKFNSELSKIGKENLSFDDLMRLVISAKLGGENWHQLAGRIDENLGKTASALVESTMARVNLQQSPSIGVECLKHASWKTGKNVENEIHPSQQDAHFTEFCDVVGESPHDPKSIALFLTLETADTHRNNTLVNADMRTYLQQTPSSFSQTVANVLEFAKEKKEEDPEIFKESYGTLLSCMSFDKSKFIAESKYHPEIPCFKPVTEKIDKTQKLAVVADIVKQLKAIDPKVNPAKVSFEDRKNYTSLLSFIERARGDSRPRTADVAHYVELSSDLLEKYQRSQYSPAEYHDSLVVECNSISKELRAFKPDLTKLKPIGDHKLFDNIRQLDNTIPVEELEVKLAELQARLNKAKLFSSQGMF